MKIKVTEKYIQKSLDIKKSESYRSYKDCPIALAISDQWREVEFFGVRVRDPETFNIVALADNEATEFVNRYDSDLEVEPFEFELEVKE